MPMFEVGIAEVRSASVFVIADNAEEAKTIVQNSELVMRSVCKDIEREYIDYKVGLSTAVDPKEVLDDIDNYIVTKDGELLWADEVTEKDLQED